MKIVIAPDSFKESLSADKCCQAIKAGFSTVFPDARYVCLPIADGGEGTVDAMVAATGGKRVSVDVSGPMGEKVNGFYGLTGDGKTAIIEMAAASGLMLVGPRGAAAVFGPQKGATPEMVETLENGLRNYARVLHALTGRDMSQIPGGGAAGGMGIAAIVFLEAEMKPGIEIVMQAVKLEEAVKEASLVITGEGRIDSQTAGGKAPIGVASVAKRHHVPVIGIAGVLGDGVEVVHRHGIDAVFSILPRLAPLPEVLANGEQNLYHSACNIARVIKLGQDIGTR